MNKVIFAILLGLGFSLSVLAQTAPTTSATDSVPTLPKVWTGVAGDTSIGAISRKNPLHYLHVGETSQVKGWNKYDSPATLTILKQVGRHLDLEFKNPKYQINEVGTLSADGKQIQITSKEATGLFTISGDKITGCGSSRGTNGLFGHWLGGYSAWCDEYTVGTTPAEPSTQVVATPPKVWTGFVSSTSLGAPTKHNPKHETNVVKDKAVKGWITYDEPRTITVIRQEGRHIEVVWKSARTETKVIGMLSADGKQLQMASLTNQGGLFTISGDKISGCYNGRGSDGSFYHFFNNYGAICFEFTAGTAPPVPPQDAPTLPKEWRGTLTDTSIGAHTSNNPNHTKAPKGWNVVDEARTLTVLRQEGRHLEFLLKSPRGKWKYIGTLSQDGKQLQMVSKTHDLAMTLSGNTMSGCGSAHGGDGSFSHWINSYSAYCFEYVAVK